ESDYLPNPYLSKIDDLDSGNRFENALNITSLKTSTHDGSQATGPLVAVATSAGASASSEVGSTDCAGVIVLSPNAGQTFGTVSVTYNQAYHGTPPVIVASLEDSAVNSQWSTSAQMRVVSSFLDHFVLAWSNGGSAPPSGAKIT